MLRLLVQCAPVLKTAHNARNVRAETLRLLIKKREK